jgi:hypothetical protein
MGDAAGMTADRFPGCTGKVQFETRAAAKRARAKTKGLTGRRLHIYRCLNPACGCFHLTKTATPRDDHRGADVARRSLAATQHDHR